MNLKKVIILLAVLTTFICNVSAANISILINQQNIVENGTEQDKVFDTSRVIESALLDALYNYGHIVSNEPIVVGSKWETSNREALFAAQDGFVDYYVLVTLNYDVSDSTNPNAVIVDNIDSIVATITNIWTNKVVDQLTIKNITQTNNETEMSSISRVIISLGKEINSKVRSKR